MKENLFWDRLKDLKDHIAPEALENKEILDSKGRIYATGKRKTSIARVWIKPGGRGHFTINGRTKEDYFPRQSLLAVLSAPFRNVNRVNEYDVFCTVAGGGSSGQVGAIRHGISKAIQLYEPSLRSSLKAAGFLTRDSRKVERKKPGLRKARRKPQFSKR